MAKIVTAFRGYTDAAKKLTSPYKHRKQTQKSVVLFYYAVSVRFALEQAIRHTREGEVQLYSFFNLGVKWGVWSTPHPSRFTPGKDTRCQFV
jgi:hypothetical protein